MSQAHRQPDPTRVPGAWRAVACAGLLAALAGCQSSPFSTWRQALDDSLSKAPTKDEMGDDRNFLARWLTPKAVPPSDPTKNTPLVKGPGGWQIPKVAPNPEAEAEFKAAEKLFQQGNLAEAEKAFGTLAKKHKGNPWGEKGQFFVAETQFQRGKYVRAHDNYEKLFADYPNSIYLDKLIRREYEIGQIWLAQGDPKAKPEQKIPWYGRFDGRLPLLDTAGNGQSALEHVRQHNPEGELADDVSMQIADLHMKQADYETAAEDFDRLVQEYPKSPYLQRAYLSAIDARIKGYIGPEYDSAGLDKARGLIHHTMRTFPDRPEGNEKLVHTLDLINDQTAERMYKIGEYYRRVGVVVSAEYYFGMIPQRWPKSPWAVKAKTQLAELAKMPRTKAQPFKMMTQPGTSDPFSSGMGSGGMGGMGMPGGGMGMPGGGMGMPGGMY